VGAQPHRDCSITRITSTLLLLSITTTNLLEGCRTHTLPQVVLTLPTTSSHLGQRNYAVRFMAAGHRGS
jgi:hypothetical protein